MKYDKRKIMTLAWEIYRKEKGTINFSEALHRAWQAVKAEPINEETIEAAKNNAGVTEEIHTWFDWSKRGYTVIHGSKCLFQCTLIWATKGDGKFYKASFFGLSQVEKKEVEENQESAVSPV